MIFFLFSVSLVLSFLCFWDKHRNKHIALIGAILYSFMPYHLYHGFELKSISISVVFAFIPIVIFAINRYKVAENKREKVLWVVLAFGVSSLIGWINPTFLIVSCLFIIFAATINRGYFLVPFSLSVIAANGILKNNYWRFLLFGTENDCQVDLRTIAGNGYDLGDFFMIWIHRDGRPGLGIGLLISIFVVVYVLLSNNGKNKNANSRNLCAPFGAIALSYKWGLWDMVARVHPIALRFVSLLGTPGILMGIGGILLCVSVLEYWEILLEEETKFAKVLMSLTVLLNVVSGVLLIV